MEAPTHFGLIYSGGLRLLGQGSSYSCRTSTRPLQQLHKQGAVKIKIKEFTFAILTTPIAQGDCQIHGIKASICFDSWISTTFYIKQEKKLRFLTRSAGALLLIIQFGQSAYQGEFLHISHGFHVLHTVEVCLHSAKAGESLRSLMIEQPATVTP